MKLRILSQDHDCAAESPAVVNDGFSVTEDFFKSIQVYPDRVILEQIL